MALYEVNKFGIFNETGLVIGDSFKICSISYSLLWMLLLVLVSVINKFDYVYFQNILIILIKPITYYRYLN
ncbi:unnamed protein product [Aphis gossypii]|uniref:Uncharacterized protein n=1 Tax=Aphis gossypii TaxID=80765 RepID=A0A9P0NHM5_APHGO|nr:unnamed protein product [Aphis gossypii]